GLPAPNPRLDALGVPGTDLHHIAPSQGLADRSHVVNTKDLNALQGECARHADCRRRSVQRRTRLNMAEKAFARMSDEYRALQLVQSPAISQEFDIVLRRFTEADARIDTNSMRIDSDRDEFIPAFL